jgi:uncharacterized membrane protein (UPF0127 family)
MVRHLILWAIWLTPIIGILIYSPNTTVISLENGHTINVKVAQTNKDRVKGLSGRRNLPENSGMLFVFDQPRILSFWMKEMNFPLDIIWIDQNRKVVGIERNISPETYPKIYSPETPSKYALEINGGYSDKIGLSIGEQLLFEL